MMFCGQTTITTHEADRVHGTRLSCKRWTCDDCRPMRLRQLRDIAAAGHPNTFITLTSRFDPDGDPDQAAQDLVRAWRNILQRGEREGLFKKLQYLVVFEQTKKGWPHLHILARAPYIEQQWLSDRCAQYLDSPNVWIERIKSARHASNYIAKYVSKGPGRFDGCKRYWKSRRYQKHPTEWDRDLPAFERYRCFHSKPAESIHDAFQWAGWTTWWTSWYCFEAHRPDPDTPAPWFDGYLWNSDPPP